MAGEFSIQINSPDQKLIIRAELIHNRLYYKLLKETEELLRPSSLGFVFSGSDSLNEVEILDSEITTVDETWKTAWGQRSEIRNNYRQLELFLKDKKKDRKFKLIFRAFNDGIAFRYEFSENPENLTILSEESRFAFAGNNDCWWIWADYYTLEKLYNHSLLSKAQHVAAPFTMVSQSGTYMSILEADLDDYAMMSLKQEAGDSLCFKVNLAPWADGSAVKTSGAFKTPWRVMLIGDNAGSLLESNIVLNLNEPSLIKDISWIKPMKYIGIWWEMHLGLASWGLEGGRHGANTNNAKRYINFAAEHKISGVLFEGWNTGWENWGKPDAFDFVTPYPDFDIRTIAAYAKNKGIEIIGHHETGGDIIAYEKQLDSAFALYKSLGIHIVKTGYAGPTNPNTENHHGQYMVRHFNKVMRIAAKYQIMLDVHEPSIPSGLSRTYPNLMSFECVRGMEWNAWSEGNPPTHTCTLPFTRGLAGPMDYTPGIFDILENKQAEKRVKWNWQDKGISAVHSTLCNQIALMIVLYSPLQMAADLPENYEGQQAFSIIEQIPTSWDETHFVDGKIGEFLVVARRSGSKWFIAGITNEEARKITIPLGFLKKSETYSISRCFDGKDAHFEKNPTEYTIDKMKVTGPKSIEMPMAAGGGGVIILEVD